MKNEAFQTVVDVYGDTETDQHTILRSGEMAALQGIQGNELDTLFVDIRQLVAAKRHVPLVKTGVPELLDSRWAGIAGLKTYAGAELSPQMVLNCMDPQRLKSEPHAIPRRAGRLAFARALTKELDGISVRSAPSIHTELSPGALATADARLQAIQSITSAAATSDRYRFARFPEAMRRYRMDARRVSRLAMRELDPQWVVQSWRKSEQRDVLFAARTIVNARKIARGAIRAAESQRTPRSPSTKSHIIDN